MSRILIVDDDPQTLDVMDFCLTLEGHDVFRAVNGEEAVEIARREQPDVIILDSMMPVMDGITAACTLRDDIDTAEIPIVMLTARATDTDIWEGYQSGVASYVTKPLDLDVLQGELARIESGQTLVGAQ